MNVLLLKIDTTQEVPLWLLERADRVYLVLDAFDAARELDPRIRSRVEKTYLVSSCDSIDEISAVAVDLLCNGVQIDKIATHTEFSQYAAGYLAGLLNVHNYSSEVALNTRDKRRMKQLIAGAGLATARFLSVSDASTASAKEIVDSVGLPLVLKPANGMSTMSTYRLDTAEELNWCLKGFTTRPEIRSQQLIAEAFIHGEELHIDAIWRGGKPWIFYVSRYFVPRLEYFTNGGINGSAMLNEDEYPELYARLRAFHDQVNLALSLEDGATHLEVFMDPQSGEITFSEIASRYGGASIFEMIRERCGVDERELWLHELTGRNLEELTLKPSAFSHVGVINLGPRSSGYITELPDELALLADPNISSVTVSRSVGELVELHHPAVWCILTVIVADSEVELEAAAARITDTYLIGTATSQAKLRQTAQ